MRDLSKLVPANLVTGCLGARDGDK